ncbi:hypothetical protein JCM10213_004762 [Rhodosporidiobolus nylandii]
MVYNLTSLASKPNLNPPALPEPDLYQPGDDSLPTSFRSRGSHGSNGGARGKDKKDDKEDRKKGREAPQGNYRSYYTRRRLLPSSLPSTSTPASLDAPDPRLALIPPEWLARKRVLDVGCNAGLVSIEVAQRWGAAKVTGVDVDAELVRAAKGNAELAWSRQAPLPRLQEEATYLSATSSRKRSRPSSSRSRSPSPTLPTPLSTSSDAPSPFAAPSLSYFPLSLPRTFGYLPTPRGLLARHVEVPEVETQGVLRRGKRKVMPEEVRAFPENLRFRAKDWVEDEVEEDREGYDVILAFSITKWIHLSSLNPGLLTFFRRCFTSLLPGGRLILEPQPFSSYSRSIKNLRHTAGADELQRNYERLESGPERGWRAEEGEFEQVLLESIGFERKSELGYTGEEGSTWRRPVQVYEKRKGGSWGV